MKIQSIYFELAELRAGIPNEIELNWTFSFVWKMHTADSIQNV